MQFRITRTFAVVIVAFSIVAVNSASLGAEETTGQKFRAVLGNLEKWCKDNKIGPYLDRNDPEYRSKRGATDCDMLRLQPRDWREVKMVKLDSQPYPVPEHWLATPEGRFAHSIKLPPPHEQQKAVYRLGMSAGEYFQELCRSEAGDFIFKTVENVDGVIRIRGPEIGTDDMLRHLYATEGAFGVVLAHQQTKTDTLGESLVQPPHGRFKFAETRISDSPVAEGVSYLQFFRLSPGSSKGNVSTRDDRGNWISVPRIVADRRIKVPEARYGFIWRGVSRPYDRDLGIVGVELVIWDTERREPLAVRRAFRITGVNRNGVWWLTAAHCPQALATSEGSFIYRVLKPAS